MRELATTLRDLISRSPDVDVEVARTSIGDGSRVLFNHRLHITGEGWDAPADWGVAVESGKEAQSRMPLAA